MDEADLRSRLARFGGTERERRAVARRARDLADQGRVEADSGRRLTASVVADHLADAPEGGPADRWNWWVGSLELAYGDYVEFRLTRW